MTQPKPITLDTTTINILDAHAHAFPDKVAKFAMPKLTEEALWQPVHPSTDGTLQGLTNSMATANINKTVLCSVATKPEQVEKITDWSAASNSESIIAFPSIHPDYPEPEKELERIAALNLKGIKFHPQYMNCALDDPRAIRIAKAAAENNLAMACHTGYDLAYEKDQLAAPQQLLTLHQAAPTLRLQACHLGGWRRWDESIKHLVGQPIYLETSFCLGQCSPDLLNQILEKHPPQFILFGTDTPWADAKEELAKFLDLPLPPDVIKQALWQNALDWLDIKT